MGTDYTLAALIIGILLGGAAIYFKMRLDAVEDRQKSKRNSYLVNEKSENLSAVILRLLRDIDDFNQYQNDVQRWGSLIKDELRKALEISQDIRGNGTKKGRDK